MSMLEGWIRQKTGSNCKKNVFCSSNGLAYFWRVNINNKQCSTFTFMYLGQKEIGCKFAPKTLVESKKDVTQNMNATVSFRDLDLRYRDDYF